MATEKEVRDRKDQLEELCPFADFCLINYKKSTSCWTQKNYEQCWFYKEIIQCKEENLKDEIRKNEKYREHIKKLIEENGDLEELVIKH